MTFALRAAVAFAALAAAACTAPGPATTPGAATGPGPFPLANADFEKEAKNYCVEDWGCVGHAGPFSHRWFVDTANPGAGKQSMCIEPITKEPWGKAVHAIINGPWKANGGRVRLSALVRVENVAHTQAGMGGGLFITVHGNKRSYADKLLHGTTKWERSSVEIDVPAQASVLEVGVVLQGTGRVCVDDVTLDVLSVGKPA